MKNGWYDEDNFLRHYVNGKFHNEKGPAIIWGSETKDWWQNDYPHRLNGPAWEYYNGAKYWYYQGKRIDCKSQQEFERIIKLRSLW